MDGTLARVLGSHPLSEGSIEQLTALWRNEFQAVTENGSFTVRTPTFQSVEAFVAEKLAQPAFAKFLRAESRRRHGRNDRRPPGRSDGRRRCARRSQVARRSVVLDFMNAQKTSPLDARINLRMPMGVDRAVS